MTLDPLAARKELSRSEIYTVIFTDEAERDPAFALELGLAILLDKPLFVVAPLSKILPHAIRKLAQKVERYDPKLGPAALEVATFRLEQHWLERKMGGTGKEAGH